MKYVVLATMLSVAVCLPSPARAQEQPCPPAGFDRARLEALKADNWEIANRRERERFARAVAACVASPDPFLRDGVAYEALAIMLRERRLGAGVRAELTDDMIARLAAPEGAGFERPFAALVLSELARADRIEAFLTPERRTQLLDAAITSFTSVRDYRGFDEREGWRHGVAHGADLLLQLAVNPAFGRDEQTRIRDAIATQISPEGHFYVYGEPERMGRVIFFMARRGAFSEAEWSAWLTEIASPSPLQSWNEAFASQAGLARRHNVTAFVSFLATTPRITWDDEEDDVLIAGAESALRAMR
jgi:hypothetical protein